MSDLETYYTKVFKTKEMRTEFKDLDKRKLRMLKSSPDYLYWVKNGKQLVY